MESLITEYGTCPCGGRYASRTVEVKMTIGGRQVTFEEIPQGACPLCESRIYKTEVLERLESLMHQRELDPREDREF